MFSTKVIKLQNVRVSTKRGKISPEVQSEKRITGQCEHMEHDVKQSE